MHHLAPFLVVRPEADGRLFGNRLPSAFVFTDNLIQCSKPAAQRPLSPNVYAYSFPTPPILEIAQSASPFPRLLAPTHDFQLF